MKKIRPLFLLALFSTFATLAQQQTNFRFRNLSAEQGLELTNIVSMGQDSLGYIWFQNFDVVSRYDGYSFKTYRFNPKNPDRSLPEGTWGKIYVDRNGSIWLGPGYGRYFLGEYKLRLSKFDMRADAFKTFEIDLDKKVVFTLEFDPDRKSAWLGTHRKGLYHYNFETKQFVQYLNPDTAINRGVNSILQMNDAGTFLYLRTGGGIVKFSKADKQFSRPTYTGPDTIMSKGGGVVQMAMIKRGAWKGQILINTWFRDGNRNVLRMDSTLKVLQRIPSPGGYAFDMMGDDDGVIWIMGVNKGVFRWDPKDTAVINIRNIPGDEYSLSSDIVESVMLDRDQNFWVGTEDKGASMLTRSSVQVFNFSFPGIYSAKTYASNGNRYAVVFQSKTIPAYIDTDCSIHIAKLNDADSIKFRKLDFRLSGYINGIVKGKKYLWVTANGGIVGLPTDPSTGEVTGPPVKQFMAIPGISTLHKGASFSIYEDDDENLWIGSRNSGITKINTRLKYGEPNSVVNYRHSPADSNSIISNNFTSVFPHGQDSRWVLTNNGIDLMTKDKFEHVFPRVATCLLTTRDKTVYIGTPSGLYFATSQDNFRTFIYDSTFYNLPVSSIAEDGLLRLWVTNDQGVFCYDRRNGTILRFDKNDGIDHCTNGEAIGLYAANSSDVILTTSVEGISLIDASSLKPSETKCLPVLTSLILNNEPVSTYGGSGFSLPAHISTLSELELDYLHNNFSITFAAMEMAAPVKNLYQYKLEGYDERWIATNWQNRRATYTNLNPGTYTFRVKASNRDGVWSELERTLIIDVLPPPWKTWWAYTSYGILIVGTLYAARRNIVQRERLSASYRLEHMELEKAREIDKIKSAFFTNISHEFRTPLTLIAGPAQNLLEEFASNPKVRSQIAMIQRNADLLLKLINQLLDLAKLEAGSLNLVKEPVLLSQFLRVTSQSFSSHAARKQIQYIIDVFDEPVKANLDRSKLETIIINLIGNALKFTPPNGQVKFYATLSKSQSDTQLVLVVNDSGIGIAPAEQKRVFERFYQVNDGDAHKEIGTGIGLALVKELTELMKGRIELVSELHKGSEFRVTIPLEILPVDQEDIAQSRLEDVIQQSVLTESAEELSIEETKPTIAKILVVEDNYDLRSFVVASFGNEYECLEAANGAEGLELAFAHVPDLIVSDVMMPEMDGIAMTERLKKDLRTNHIPVILLTAKTTEENKLTGLSSGAEDYLTKPFNKQELLLKVRNSIATRQKIREKLRLDLLKEAPRVDVLSADEQFLVRVKNAIQARLSDEKLSVESLAEEIGLSRVHLYRKVIALTGASVNELIRSFRLQKAAQLLEQSWGPVSQVAYEVGFSNLSYFGKCFKEEFGVLPSEYPAKKS